MSLNKIQKSMLGQDVQDEFNKMGLLSQLQTTDKSNLVNAINENKTQLADLASLQVNAKSYCVGDGTTDDTTALRNAIAATPSGGILIIAHPIYVTDTIEFNKRMSIKCVGKGAIIPSGHVNTAVIVGDKNGIARYQDVDIELLILGGASTRNYGLILQNLSNCRIKATVMCGSVSGIALQGMLVNDIKLIVSVNYTYPYAKTMPTTNSVRLLWSNVAGGYVGGNNANNIDLIIEGGATGLLIDDHQSQGNNFIKGTIQGTNKAFDITKTFSMSMVDMHVEATTQVPTLTSCQSTKIAGAFNNDSLSLVGCLGTTIENISVVNLTVDANCKGTVINGITLNGGAITDNATDTVYNCAISNTNQTTSFVHSAYSAHKNGTNQTAIASGTSTIVQFPTVEFDVKSEFLTSYGVWAFKPKRKGKYRIEASIQFTTAVDLSKVTISIYKNSALYKSVNGAFISVLANVASPNGDYFQVYVTQTTGASVDIDGTIAKTFFCGSEI